MADAAELLHDTVEITGGTTIITYRCDHCDDIHLEFHFRNINTVGKIILNNQEAIQLADTLYRYARRVS